VRSTARAFLAALCILVLPVCRGTISVESYQIRKPGAAYDPKQALTSRDQTVGNSTP